MIGLRAWVIALSIALGANVGAADPDVVVYGGTPAGVAAAVEVGRAGLRVLLVEPERWVGGMAANGLSHPDFRTFEAITGFYGDLNRRARDYYAAKYGPDSLQVKDSLRGTHAEPHVTRLLFERMLTEQKTVSVRVRHRLKSVETAGTGDARRVTAATFTGPDGAEVRVVAAVFVDATYEGDLAAAGGAKYRVGREGKPEYGESLAPDAPDAQVQGYNFRLCMTAVPGNRLAPLAPPGYRRDDFVPVLPLFADGRVKRVFGEKDAIYKPQIPLPNGKQDINDVSRSAVRLSLPDVSPRWPDGSRDERAAVFAEHVRHNVGLLYFLQTDDAVPEKVRAEAREWGLCKDEFPETGNLPDQLYVREARRVDGRYVFTQKDVEHAPGDARSRFHPDAVAAGDYGPNCHGTGHTGPQIGGTHTGELYQPSPAYQIPYGVIVPAGFDNLLVPVACSFSHVGFCTLRYEVIWAALGQAAGVAAALAVTDNIAVPAVSVGEVQRRLHAAGAATTYVSDVPPGSPDFAAVQWWASKGGLHGLDPAPAKPGQRGRHIVGQYFEAFPGHAAELGRPLDGPAKGRWLALARGLNLPAGDLAGAKTRGEFVRAAYHAAAGSFALAPNGVLSFEFPDLPDTLAAMSSGKRQPARLTARLPENYSPGGKFPVFVYLIGGPGGRGEERDLALGLSVIGRRDYVCVALPLFKRKLDPSEPSKGLMVSMDDFAVISRCYRVMLERLFAAVPNLTTERSVLGGHSNGAHTTGVLLAGQDDFVLAHFRAFYLHEGGVGPLFANVLQKQSFRGLRFLVMTGGKGFGPDPKSQPPFASLVQNLRATAARGKLDFTFVTMDGYGHEQPPEYLRVVGQWARGEPLDDVPARAKQIAAELTLPLAAHPDSSRWPDLLNADLSNCKVTGGVWHYRDGVLTAAEGQNLWTKNEYGDCILDLEFRFEAGADGGVFVYNSDPEKWINTSAEIQICDDAAKPWRDKPSTWHSGAFFGRQPPLRAAVKPAGEWNRMTITCRGPRISVLLNGEVANEIDLARFTDGAKNPDGGDAPEWLRGPPWAGLPKKGRIGFLGRHAGAGIEYRNVRVFRLPAPAGS